MAFDEHGGPEGTLGGMVKECKPDYEAQAAALKKKMDATEALEKAIFRFCATNNTHRFSRVSSIAELLGGVVIVKDEQQRGYAEILKMIEKE